MTSYASIQMFKKKLNQLLNNCNDNNPSRHQFQLLYQELDTITKTLFINQHQDPPELQDLKKRFTDAADEAEYIVDLFLSTEHHATEHPHVSDASLNLNDAMNDEHLPTAGNYLNIDDVMRSFESIKVEFMSITVDKLKLNSSPRPARTGTESAAGISYTRDSKQSKKLSDETIVGFEDDAGLLRDKLMEDQRKLDVVSIVGMGGLGKTTLATKVFDDPFVVYRFEVRVWVTVSQIYDKRAVLIQIFKSERTQLELEKASDSELRKLVHRYLMGKRYLIVIDDIWHTQTWDEIKLFLKNDDTASRILLTSRLVEVAKHANLDGLIHHLGYMNKENGWELLSKKVFHDILYITDAGAS